MQGLRIAKPAVYAEGEEVDAAAAVAYLNRRRNVPVVMEEEDDEVWELPLNMFKKGSITPGNNANLPLSVQRNLSWANKPPSTPKAQRIKAKNNPPKLKRNRKTRKAKGRKSRKQNRR
jgi:hypothetical protein